MFGGRGGDMDPRKMKKMMDQMGIDFEEIEDVEEVVIKTPDREYVFDAPTVNKMGAQGQETYQVVGEPEEKERINEDDVELVAQRADVDEGTAREALKEADGDLAEAISSLE